MSYKLIVLAPSAGGKSTLMRYLREHTNLHIVETDEEVLRANNNVWPDNELKNKVLVPRTTTQIIELPNAIYFAGYIPEDLLIQARQNGFTVILVDLTLEILSERNTVRMKAEGYQDASPWFQMQLDNFEGLRVKGLIDKILDGTKPVEELASEIAGYAEARLE